MSKILDLAAMGISIERRGKWYDPKPWKAIYKGEEIASGEGRRRAARKAERWCSAHADELSQERGSN
jgi:hypothetical protein